MIFYIFHQNVLFLHQNEENHRKHLKTIKISSCLLFLMKKQIPTQKSPRRIFLIGTVTHMYEFSRTQAKSRVCKICSKLSTFSSDRSSLAVAWALPFFGTKCSGEGFASSKYLAFLPMVRSRNIKTIFKFCRCLVLASAARFAQSRHQLGQALILRPSPAAKDRPIPPPAGPAAAAVGGCARPRRRPRPARPPA